MRSMLCFLLFWWVGFGVVAFAGAQEPAQEATKIPTKGEVVELLGNEPISQETWGVWRGRLLSWIADKSRSTEPAFAGAADFVASQKDPQGDLQAPLSEDAFAWYLLGRTRLYSTPAEQPNRSAAWASAEQAYRKSIALDPNFARAHRNLALALMTQEPNLQANLPRLVEAKEELAKAAQLDPSLDLKEIPAQASMLRDNFSVAEDLYTKLWREDPTDTDIAYPLANCILSNQNRPGSRALAIEPLVTSNPSDGILACMYALGLAMDDEMRKSVAQLDKARGLGVDPKEVLGPKIVEAIEEAAQPTWFEKGLWLVVGFVVVYAVIIATMAIAGFVLASWTRGENALHLLQQQPLHVVAKGQVIRAEGEPLLAKLYAVALVFGLVLFYLALPFVALGVVAVTLGLLWLIFLLGRIPVKLVVIIVVVGCAMVWAVIKSMFARMGTGSFGVQKTRAECPKLFEAIDEVARRVDTSPVTDVYIAPGWEIGVHEEGRGPFGVFGTKRRVLTLGLAAMKHLSIDEVKSILAHEYAHFSHMDTFFSRFIHRVDLSIDTALGGMVSAGGYLNYINPFYWFLYLYYRAYSLLSAGYSRSREFLADRMACTLYGANVFQGCFARSAPMDHCLR